MKRRFQFYMPDDSIESNVDTEYLRSKGATDEFIKKRQQQYEAHVSLETDHEREWRDEELAKTDRLVATEDATYKKQVVRSSSLYEEIMVYRQQLRFYDLKYQERPIRPIWFHG